MEGRLTVDLKRMTIPGRSLAQINGDLSNLKGAYGEYGMYQSEPGTILIGLSRVNAPGIDEVKLDGSIFKVMESKTTTSGTMPLSNFKNYFYVDKITGNLKLNKNYIYDDLKERGVSQPGTYFNSLGITKKVVIYIAGPTRNEVQSDLISKLQPYGMKAEFENDLGITDYAQIEIKTNNF